MEVKIYMKGVWFCAQENPKKVFFFKWEKMKLLYVGRVEMNEKYIKKI